MSRWRPESRRALPAGDAAEFSLRDRLEADYADLSAAAIDDALARAGAPWSAVSHVTVPFDATAAEAASQEACARAFLEEVRSRAGAAAARVGLSPALRG